MGNHKADARKSRHRQFFGLFLTPVAALFRACGLVMRTDGENRPEALFAGMDAAPADFVVLAVAVLPRKEGLFQPSLFANRQGTFLCP